MYKCGKSVTCNFGEVFFNERTYSVQRCEDFRETLWDSLVEEKEKKNSRKNRNSVLLIDNIFTCINYAILFWCTPCRDKKQAHKRTSSKWNVQKRKRESENMREKNAEKKDKREREIWIVVCAQRIPERDGSKYCICVLSLKIYTEMLIAGLTFLQIFICKHLTRGVSR